MGKYCVKTPKEGKMEGRDLLHMFLDFIVRIKCHQMSYTVIYTSFIKVSIFTLAELRYRLYILHIGNSVSCDNEWSVPKSVRNCESLDIYIEYKFQPQRAIVRYIYDDSCEVLHCIMLLYSP